LYDFENREKLFAAVDSRMKFSLLAMSGKPIAQANFSFFLTQAKQIEEGLKPNNERVFQLSSQDIALINPNTLTCPVFRTKADAELTKKIYQHVPILDNEKTGVNTWGISFMRMFDMANDSHLFKTRCCASAPEDIVLKPLYEAKMFHQFDHRWGSYTEGECKDVSLEEKSDPNFAVNPRYWVDKGASHFCNKQLYLGMKYLYGKPFREFRDLKRLGVHYVIRTEIVPAKALLPV
jgi:hypothetical protein